VLLVAALMACPGGTALRHNVAKALISATVSWIVHVEARERGNRAIVRHLSAPSQSPQLLVEWLVKHGFSDGLVTPPHVAPPLAAPNPLPPPIMSASSRLIRPGSFLSILKQAEARLFLECPAYEIDAFLRKPTKATARILRP
jgi:hypothetical protein